ncbi:MAG: hypothetical protein M3170_05295 [Candidatus Dormibacteraeota bacterium]|nr:hypothetical protein [Candidatus Dormibacteraeota bacterium]
MERRSEDQAPDTDQDPTLEDPDTPIEARDPEQAASEGDPVQGWQEDEPTELEQEPDDGYHPEQGGDKYVTPDPVDEPLLAREEGLTPDEEEELNAESEMP